MSDAPAIESHIRQAPRAGLQYGALPHRTADEGLEILLVTSRDTRRWVIPKGWPLKGEKPRTAAAREAMEEAGVIGKLGKGAIGDYAYVKRLKNGAPLACEVEVFALKVIRQRKRWPEQRQRTAHWFPFAEAAASVHEPELQKLIRRFGQLVGRPAENKR